MSIGLYSDISKLKSFLKSLENNYLELTKDIRRRDLRWKDSDKKLDELASVNEGLVTLNVGGKKYQISLHTLKQRKNTLFYKQILRHEIIKDEETFYDRDHHMFDKIINYLRTGKLRINDLTEDQKEELLHEAEFYELSYITEILSATPGEVEFTNFSSSGEYIWEGNVIGTNNVKDLAERDLNTGICAGGEGYIIIHLSRESDFQEIEIAGYNGNSVAWLASNGKSAAVQTSNDLQTWTNVGNLPDDYGHVVKTVKLTRSKARYIKFFAGDLIGIGYLSINDVGVKKVYK